MKLSFVIPAYNAEKFIRKCVESIAQQGIDEKEYEIIVVNDGSKDNTAEVCGQLSKEFTTFQYYTNENHGPGYTRNYGIRKAKGDYIWCVDSDDFLTPGILPEVLENLEEGLPMYVIGFQHIDEKENVLRKVSFGSEILTPAEFLARGHYVNYIWCRIVSRSLFEDHSIYFKEDIIGPEDLHLTFRLMKLIDKLKCIDLICYNYIVNPASLMNTRSDEHMKKLAEATLLVGKELREEWQNIKENPKKVAFDGWLSNYLYGFLLSLYRFQYKPQYIQKAISQLKKDDNYPVRIHSARKKHRFFTSLANNSTLFLSMVRIRRIFA